MVLAVEDGVGTRKGSNGITTIVLLWQGVQRVRPQRELTGGKTLLITSDTNNMNGLQHRTVFGCALKRICIRYEKALFMDSGV